MAIEQQPVQLEVVSCKSSLDTHIVRLRIALSEAIRAQFETSGHIPFQLIWREGTGGEKTYDHEMPVQGEFEGQMDFRIPVPEVGALKVRFALPNGAVLEATGSIPPVEEYREDFTDQVAHGKPFEEGDHFRIPEGIYVMDRNLVVQKGAILQADPGVQLRFAPGTGIYSEGTLFFKGSAKKPIYMCAKDPEKRWWGVILNGPYSTFSTFEACGFESGEGTPVTLKEGKLFVDRKGGIKRGGGLLAMNMANSEQPIRLEGVTFRSGQADQGGGLAVYNSTVALSDVHFIENRVTRSGGGLHVEHGSLKVVTGVSFSGNSSNLTGGAFAFTHGSKFEGTPPTFTENTAGRRGRDGFVLASDVDTSTWQADVLEINPYKKK